MTIERMDHVSVIVDDLPGAIAFFTALGMTLEGRMPVEGPWVDRLNGLEGVRVEIAMMKTPDGHGRVELTKFLEPQAFGGDPAPPNTLGLRQIMFAVDDLDATLARLEGAERVGERVQYGNRYRSAMSEVLQASSSRSPRNSSGVNSLQDKGRIVKGAPRGACKILIPS